MLEGRAVLDLDYSEDSGAEVDLNVVRTDDGRYVEIQGTAETSPFSREHLDAMLELADRGIDALHDRQREVLGDGVGRLLTQR
jgi:ribonuclease PH